MRLVHRPPWTPSLTPISSAVVLSGDLERAAEAASQAYGNLADVMADELAQVSRTEDAVGRDEYVLWSRLHVGGIYHTGPSDDSSRPGRRWWAVPEGVSTLNTWRVHLGLPAPQQWGGGTWTAAKAWPFLLANAQMDEEFLVFELDRDLGWSGQAPSYKIGERLWHRLRDDYAAQVRAAGEEFDLAAFHRRALDVGSVGLDMLRRSLLR